ncbi:unnamed protein product [Symbiodinium natans]|uniref:RNA helicase n=1 Tax=Symbiodinium natans TaxID=878477 RepID=A0A812K5A3_9DINO|nr:unnamed protein product [Symbiodinium natans]
MLVLGPTRELVAQIQRSAERFCKTTQILLETIYGGASKAEQLAGLRKMPAVVVATPGRLIEFLEEEPAPCSLKHVRHMVLDEADRMLGEGFEVQVRQILAEATMPNRQTLLFSATWPPAVKAFASTVLRQPVEVRVGAGDSCFSTNPNVVQDVMFLRDDSEKPSALCALLKGRKNVKAIVFVATKRACQQLERSLRGRVPLVCDALHGDRSQRDREAVLDHFRKGQVQVLLATDVAGRGIDVSNVTLVVNYDCPRSAEDYIHRIGRTGRQGKGVAISILTDREQDAMELIANVIEKAGTRMPPELAKRLGMLTSVGKVDPRMHWKEPWQGLDGNKYQKEDLKSAVESLWT